MKLLGMNHDRMGITNKNEETDPAVFLQNRREGTGLMGQSKKENMDLVKKRRQ